MTKNNEALEARLKQYKPFEDTAKAREYLGRLCQGDRPSMCVPPDVDDYDIIFCRIISKCEELDRAALSAPVVDVEKLKKTLRGYHTNMEEYRQDRNFVDGYNKAIDHLAATGRLGAIPEGFVLVPIEPTEEMLNAARDWSIKKNGAGVGNDQATGCYKARVAAAQKKGE